MLGRSASNTMSDYESGSNAQTEALVKNQALAGQIFIITASNYINDSCLDWMGNDSGQQDSVKAEGGWLAVVSIC